MTQPSEDNVVTIGSGVSIKAMPVSPKCVEVLEEALAQAKAGEIINVALAKQHHDGLASYHMGGNSWSYSLLGALERVVRAIHETLDEAGD